MTKLKRLLQVGSMVFCLAFTGLVLAQSETSKTVTVTVINCLNLELEMQYAIVGVQGFRGHGRRILASDRCTTTKFEIPGFTQIHKTGSIALIPIIPSGHTTELCQFDFSVINNTLRVNTINTPSHPRWSCTATSAGLALTIQFVK